MNTKFLIREFRKVLASYDYKLVGRSNLLSPYFKGEFNLSGAHGYLIPALQASERKEVDKIGVVDLVVRDVDLEIVGVSNHHHLLFEMGVFGCFGYMPDLPKQIESQLKVLYQYYEKIGLDNSKVVITISCGGVFINKHLGFDTMSYEALINVGFKKENIIATSGRRNFMLSKGIDRLVGYNIEFFYPKNGQFVEIGSSNIYKYLNKLSYIKETVNNGVGCGVGFERLSYVLSDTAVSVLDIDPFQKIYRKLVSRLEITGDYLIRDKIQRLIELSKSVIFIVNDNLGYDKTPQGKKLKKYTAKIASELEYLSLDKVLFLDIVYSEIRDYYDGYVLTQASVDIIARALDREY